MLPFQSFTSKSAGWPLDLLIVALVTALGTFALIWLDAFERLQAFFAIYENSELDEIFLSSFILALSFLWFSWRRYRHSALINMANLQSEVSERKRMEDLAKASEARLRNAIENIPGGFVLRDAENRITLFNDLFRDWNDDIADLIAPGVQFETLIQAAKHKRKIGSSEGDAWVALRLEKSHNNAGSFEEQHANGRWYRVEERRTGDGGYVSVLTDITELKQSQNLLCDAINTMPEGFALYDSDERLVVCNEPYRKSLPGLNALGILEPDVSMEEILQAGIQNGLVPPHYESGETYLAERLERFRNPPGPFEFMTSNGQWIRSEERKISNGGTIGIRIDISARRQSEKTLKDSETLLKNIIDNVPSVIIVKNHEGRFTLVNKRFEEWYGISSQDALGKTTHELFSKEFSDAVTALDELTALQATTGSVETEISFVDGGVHRIIATKFPIPSAIDGSHSIGTIATDITQQRKSEEQLRQAQKMEAIGQLTGGIAHDFNNILGVVIGNLEFLQESYTANDKNKILAESAIRAALRGAELTQRLLSFARKQALAPELIDLNGLVLGMIELLRRTLGETISIEPHTHEGLWATEIDPAQFEAALLNLATNARDAMPDGGRLIMETANIVLTKDDIRTQDDVEPGPYVMLSVSDTGVGMTNEVREHAFDPFFTTKAVGEGSGLGLSMVHGFVRQSQGSVSITSEPGAGATIRLLFKASPNAATEIAATLDTREPATRPNETILVVEDDAELRELVVSMITHLGYTVLEASNGVMALALIDGDAPVDLLFTDVILPGNMTGAALASEAIKRRTGLKVLYTSGYNENFIVHDGMLEKDSVLLSKPYRRQEIAERLRDLLDAPQAPS